MIKGRSSFTVQVKEPEKAQSLINEWLQVYKFSVINQKGEQCYRCGDAWTGYAYFNYQIQGNQVFMQAWRKNLFGSEISAHMPNVTSFSYSDMINQLLDQLQLISASNNSATTTTATTPSAATISTNLTTQNGATMTTPTNNFRNVSTKTDENLSIAAFVISICNFFMILLDGGIVLGGLGYILIFAFAVRGLKTKKRNFAIAAMILGAISLIMFIIKIFANTK